MRRTKRGRRRLAARPSAPRPRVRRVRADPQRGAGEAFSARLRSRILRTRTRTCHLALQLSLFLLPIRPNSSGCHPAIGSSRCSPIRIEDPGQIAFDGNGRMFLVELRGYYQTPDGIDRIPPVGRISLHEDRDSDGGTNDTPSSSTRWSSRDSHAVRSQRDSDHGVQHRRGVEVHRYERRWRVPTKRNSSRPGSAARARSSLSRARCSGRWTTGCTAR